MANVGRISGPLLKANLERNGIDLAVETNLLYIDVNNSRIGVNNATPGVDLDITGTSQTTSFLAGEATVDDVYINDRNISPLTGNLILNGATDTDSVIINDLSLSQNEITHAFGGDILINTVPGSSVIINDSFTVSDSSQPPELALGSVTILGENAQAEISTNVADLDLELRAAGTGEVVVNSDTQINANLNVTGNVIVGGNLTFGDADTDTITIGADFTSNLTPDVPDVYDLGTAAKSWRDAHVGDLVLTSNSLTTSVADNDINIAPTGEGNVVMDTTKALRVPYGTTAERPTLSQEGYVRWNSTDSRFEGWDNVQWRPIPFGQIVARYNFTATAGQTVFTGTDDNGSTYNITAGTEVVTKNGQVLEKNEEYTTTNTTLTLVDPASLDDNINVLSFGTFSVVDVVPQSTGGTFNGGVTVAGNITGTNNVTVNGNLVTNGTSAFFNSSNVNFTDRIFSIGTGNNGATLASDDNQDRGINFRWHNGTSAKSGFFGFDDSTGYFAFVPDATITGNVVSGSYGDIIATNFRGNLVGNAVTSSSLSTTGNAQVDGNLDVDGYASFNATTALKLPVGITSERPVTEETGQIRFNTELGTFEGYNGTAWGSIAGVIDTDRDTYIVAESSPTTDNDELEFYVAGTRELLIDSTGLTLNQQLTVPNGGTGVTTFTTNGMLFGNGTGALQVTAASNPGSNATTSYGIMTTDASNVPQWTDTIDGGTY